MARRSLSNIRQGEAGRAFIKAGGQDRGQRSGHWVIKMPNGNLVSLPTGTVKEGLLRSQIKAAGLTVEAFLELL